MTNYPEPGFTGQTSGLAPTRTSAPVGGALTTIGAVAAAIGLFTPFLSMGGLQSDGFLSLLFDGRTSGGKGGGYMVLIGIVLLVVGAILAFTKGSMGGSLAAAGGIVGILGLLLAIGFDNVSKIFDAAGIGLWLILIGLIVGLIGGLTALARK